VRRAAVVAALLAACGGDDAPLCSAEDGLAGELGVVDTADNILNVSPMGKNLFLEVYLEAQDVDPYDSFRLELYGGVSVFAGGDVRVGTLGLDGGETLYNSCGACLLLLIDQDLATRTPKRRLMPVAGKLVLDSVTGRLTGRLENVELREVTIDLTDPDGTGPLRPTLATAPVDGGCHARIERAAFDVAIE
jgi:hypothetical protein